MGIIKQCIRRPVAMLMAVLTVLVFGAVSLLKTPITLIPDMNLPMMVVYTSYANAGPNEVESLVTEPLESTLTSLSGVQSVDSISSEGTSIIMLTYDFGTDMTEPTAQIRDRLELVSSFLPEDASSPMLIKMNMDDTPVSYLSVNGASLDAAYAICEEVIVPRLERITGVASVDLSGGAQTSIVVELDEQAAQRYGVSLSTLSSAISGANISLPAGYLDHGSKSLLLRSENSLTSAKEVAEIPVTLPTGAVMRIADFATVEERAEESGSVSRINGQPNLTISVTKQQDANTLKVCAEVADAVEELSSQGYDISINIITDQGKMISEAITNVVTSLLAGAALAVLVLWFFLGDWKASLIISISMPISVILTFVMMYFADITVNMVSLAGLVVGVGMMVDNAIVVLESIFTCRKQGMDYVPAAETGTKLVLGAVFASTMTSVVVYLPIVFMNGLSSELMSNACWTIAFSLTASLISAITIIPCLFVQLKPKEAEQQTLADRLLEKWYAVYDKISAWTLKNAGKTVLCALLALALSLGLIPFIGAELMGSMDQGQFTISIETEEGLQLEKLDEYLQKAEEVAASIPEVEQYTASASSGSGGGVSMSMFGGGSSASVTVYLKDGHKIETSEAAQLAREGMAGLTGCEVTVTEANDLMGGVSSNEVTVYVQSKDDKVLTDTVNHLKNTLTSIDGVVAVTSDLTDGRPEARIVVDELKAAAYGLNPTYITSLVGQKIAGATAANITRDGEEVAVKLKYPEGRYETLTDLQSMTITTPMGTSVPLVEVAEIQMATGPISITHSGGDRISTVTVQYVDRDFASIQQEVREQIALIEMPGGSRVYSEQNAMMSMENELQSLGLVLMLSIFLVFMVMAVQFESLRLPLVIMSTVPFSAIGALLMLFISGSTISMISLIGMIVLVGIVVNNAIVLLDCVGQLRAGGMELDEALLQAGKTRLRPILMTTLTTVLGQLPLSLGIGSGGELMQPMALVIIGGLITSTVLTLVVLPVLYKRSELAHQRRVEKRAAKA